MLKNAKNGLFLSKKRLKMPIFGRGDGIRSLSEVLKTPEKSKIFKHLPQKHPILYLLSPLLKTLPLPALSPCIRRAYFYALTFRTCSRSSPVPLQVQSFWLSITISAESPAGDRRVFIFIYIFKIYIFIWWQLLNGFSKNNWKLLKT